MATAANTHAVSASFAREAHRLVEAGRAPEAVQLCAQGIQAYPDYCTGYLVMAAAYESAGLVHDQDVMMQEYSRRVRSQVRSEKREVTSEVRSEKGQVRSQVRSDEREVTSEVRSDEREVAGEVRSDEREVASEVRSDERGFFSPLQVIHSMPADEERKIRSTSVRLIPGLEYTSLRFEGMKMRGVRVIQNLAEPPSFRDFHVQPRRSLLRSIDGSSVASRKRPLSLEELAIRLEKVRMPRSGDVNDPPSSPPPSQSLSAPLPVITETLAKIYAAQGSYEMAIEAYRILQQRFPEKAAQFATTIEELRSKL